MLASDWSQCGLVSKEEREGGDQERGEGAGAQSSSGAAPELAARNVTNLSGIDAIVVVPRVADAFKKVALLLSRQGCHGLGCLARVAIVDCPTSAFFKA